MATESWECVEESAPHSESEDACGSTVSYAYSVCGSASEGSKHPSVVPNSDRIYINMVERMKQRKQRRRELEMQYEIARKQKEEKKRLTEELKLTMDKLQRKAMVEQRKNQEERQNQLKRQAQQRRELLCQQRELANLHNCRRILMHYGLLPWRRFMLECRRSVKAASLNYERLLMKRALQWLHIRYIQGKLSPKQRARSLILRAQAMQSRWRVRYFWHYWLEGRRGDHLHQQLFLKRCWKALKEILEYSRKLGRIGDQRNRFLLLSRSWSKWTDYARRVKSFQLLKYLEIEQIASLHWKRITYVRILRAWKDGMGVVRQEKKRMKQRAEAWTKIHSWLDEYEEVS
uniref:Sfi1 spindle body domain-containing protein n=2 Tax=Physcomitrium patens TaxID=3218 RepID=A0A7I4F4V0_PHYPA